MRRILPAAIQIVFFLAFFSAGLAFAQPRAGADTRTATGEQATGEAQAGQSPDTQAGTQSGPQSGARPEGGKQGSEANMTDEYRHSAAVAYVARTLHLPIETAAKTFEYLNFAILTASVLYFVFKLIPKIFRGRRDALARQLVDARSATEQANERLSAVEARLGRLDEEIASIRKQVEQDAAQDEARIKAALEEEKRRIAEAAGQEVEAAGMAAQRELRRFAARLAVARATSNLTLTPEIDRRLVSNFAREIAGDTSVQGASMRDVLKGTRN